MSIKCELCNLYFNGLAGHLKSKHGISTEEYKLKFPNSQTLSQETLNKIKVDKSRICEVCGKIFIYRNQYNKTCGDECRYKSVSNQSTGRKRSKNYLLIKCRTCGKERSALRYKNTDNDFCNRDCYDVYHKSTKIEVECKYENCKNVFTKYEKESQKYCSRKCYKMDYNEDRINFNTNSHYKKGYYISLRDNQRKWFDSFYELTRMKQLDMDDDVLEWSKNKIKIPYIGEDKKEHIYTPDFLVKFKDGETAIEEIKGRMTPRDLLKMEAAIPFLKKMNIKYKIIQKQDIYDDYVEPIIENYENKFGIFNRVSLLYSFMKMTKNLSNRSTCIRKQVGCIVIPENLENICSIGYNGSLPGEENGCKDVGAGKCGCVHAEINALNKLKDNHLQKNLILICTLAPCHDCSQEIIKYPIKKVIYLNSYRDNSGIKFLKNNYIEVMNYSDLVKNSNEKYIDKK